MATSGYSGTPLPKKLGLKPHQRVGLVRPPAHLEDLLEGAPSPLQLVQLRGRGKRYDIVLLFASDIASLRTSLPKAAERLHVDGAIWVCWPKKSSALFRDLTEDGVRAAAFPLRLVDIKVCAVDGDWSGLKVVFRKEARARVAKERG